MTQLQDTSRCLQGIVVQIQFILVNKDVSWGMQLLISISLLTDNQPQRYCEKMPIETCMLVVP